MRSFLFHLQILGNVGCNKTISNWAYHGSIDVHFFTDRQTGGLYCARGGQMIFPRITNQLYNDNRNPDFPTSMHLDHRGNLIILYTDIDRYEIGEIPKRDMRTTIVRCKSVDLVAGTICDNVVRGG